jgi:hypothetical protein
VLKNLDRKTAIVVSLIWISLICVISGSGLDVHIKNMVRYAFSNFKSPIQLVPGSEAIKGYTLPEHPEVGAPYITDGPGRDYIFHGSTDSPLNNERVLQRAYLYDNGTMFSLFVLTVKADIVLTKNWSRWNVGNDTRELAWLDENHLTFISDGKSCVATIGEDIPVCQ